MVSEDLLRIQMKVVGGFDLVPVARSEATTVVFGAKRRW